MPAKNIKTKLTQAVVNNALRRRDEAMIYRDTDVPGLYLRVSVRSATYYLDYKPTGVRPDGRQFASKSVKIGTVQSHSVSEARAEAARLKAQVTSGGDPAADRKAAKIAKAIDLARATTMREAAETYITNNVRGSDRHVTTESGALKLSIKEMDVEAMTPSDVTVQDVMRMLELNHGRACAVHRFGALNRFFDDMLERDMVSANPCGRVSKRHRPKPPQPRTRYYTASEVRALWFCDGLSEVQLRLLRAMLLLPLRFTEACELKASEVETDKARLVLSGKRTKNGDQFALPLSDCALALVKIDGDDSDPRVFPLGVPGKKFTGWTSLKNKIRAGSGVNDFNFHDLRRTFTTVLAENGIGDPTVADALLNHRQSGTRSGVIAAYNHSNLWPQKTRVMTSWAALVRNAVETGTWTPCNAVIPLRSSNKK